MTATNSGSAVGRCLSPGSSVLAGDLVLLRVPVYGEGLIVLPGSRPARPAGSRREPPEMPDGHHNLIRCPDSGDAGVQQHRKAGVSRVPGWPQRPDPPGLPAGLAPVAAWCQSHQLRLFQARRADIECFARGLEARGRAPGHYHPAAAHRRRVLPVRGRGGPARSFSGCARAPSAAGLRITRYRPGPQ
jgi:hypothetical protein